MLILLGAAFVVLVTLFLATRIILGWILPPKTMASVDTAVNAGVTFFFKLLVIAFAGAILYAFYAMYYLR